MLIISIGPRSVVILFSLYTDSHPAPPDITSYMADPPLVTMERPQVAMPTKSVPKYGNAELMETGDGEEGISVFGCCKAVEEQSHTLIKCHVS